ncbi:hypothetical protein JXA84_07540 [candidate division WOR-3 bacterium]|nr:hypothetical protein [candidate division WOR-3 bacterium]
MTGLILFFCFAANFEFCSFKILEEAANPFYPENQSMPVLNAIGTGIYQRSSLSPVLKSILQDENNAFNSETVYIDDTLVITQDTAIEDDIVIFQNGLLQVSGCTLRVEGDITLLDEGSLKFDGAVFVCDCSYIYEYSIFSYGMSVFEAESSTFISNSRPFSFALLDSSSAFFDNVEMDRSFITFSLTGKSTIEAFQSDKLGEFVLFTEDSASLRLSHSDTVLVWLGFPQNSSGILRGPHSPSLFVDHFTFPDSTCSGIYYTVSIDSAWGLMLATMACDSTDVTVENVELRASGSLFIHGETDSISGIVNGTHYTDFTAPFPGRIYRLINTYVESWNFYFWGKHDITFESSIFGELLGGDSSKIVLSEVICDGSGGHIGNDDSTLMFCSMSSIYTDALLEGRSLTIFYNTNVFFGRLIMREVSLGLCYNSILQNPPVVEDSGAVFISAFYPPNPCNIDDTVSITGSSYCLRTAISPYQYIGYKTEFAPCSDTSVFTSITPFSSASIVNGEISVFNTSGLSQGYYLLRFWYFFSSFGYHDSVPFTEQIELIEGTSVEEDPNFPLSVELKAFAAGENFVVLFELTQGLPVEISVYNSAGQRCAGISQSYFQPGFHRVEIPAEELSQGLFFIQFKTPETLTLTRKIILIDN